MSLRIKLERANPTITTLKCPSELPNFAVITGRNGSGKTQLLKAIQRGDVVVSGIPTHEIEFYDMDSFRPSNNASGDWSFNLFARLTARAYTQGDEGPPPVDVARKIFHDHTTNRERSSSKHSSSKFVRLLRQRIEKTKDFGMFPDDHGLTCLYDEALHTQVTSPLYKRITYDSGIIQTSDNSFNQNPVALITMAMKCSGKLPHELDYDDIMRASHYAGDTISNTISQEFASYKVDQYDWAHAQFESRSGPMLFNDLMDEYQERNSPPWDTLRNVMVAMRNAAGEDGLFDFVFSDPA